MGTSKRKTYTPEYRREAARLVIDTGRTVAAVAREIGVGEQLLGRCESPRVQWRASSPSAGWLWGLISR